jgi:hypothetical protein
MSSSPLPWSSRLPGVCRSILLLALVGSGVAADPAGTPPADPAKPYSLFMGLDIAVQQDKEFLRVRDVEGGTFVVRQNGREQRIPMRTGSGNLKVDQSLKLTGTSARITGLKTERAYSPANDPHRKFAERASAGMAAGDSNMLSGMALAGAQGAVTGAANELAGQQRAGFAAGVAAAQARLDSANAGLATATRNFAENTYQTNFSDFNNAGLAALELQQELAEENFDAMRYSFEISSDTPLNRPYLVFIVSYHEKDARPGTKEGTVIYAKAIEPVGPKPSKIHILHTGMPVGFIVDDCQVRLYNAGQEIATNVSPRRVAMTKDEAFLYLKLDRLSRAKGAKLPAAPAIGQLDEAARARLSLDQLKATYYVQVSKEGRAEAVFTDPDCSHPADAAVSAIVADMRFYPALENNKEQAGVAKLVFAQVPI